VLETAGVSMIGFGTLRFPAFFTRDSGHPGDALPVFSFITN
jgi:pseudouridine-5'-phosphate glycosidase